MFAGSILDLEPDTEYEARFVMSDPDGLAGQTGQDRNQDRGGANTARTEALRRLGECFTSIRASYKGPKLEPAFDARHVRLQLLLRRWRYRYRRDGRGSRPATRFSFTRALTSIIRSITPGDRSINATTPVEGTYYLTASGTPDKPIVIKGAGDGEVIFDGNGNFNLFNVKAANYNYFEGVTIRNTDIAIWAGTQFIAGSKGLTVKRCRFENVNLGVFTNYSGSSDFYIADNYFFGRDDPNHLFGWTGNFWAQFDGVDGQKFPPTLASYTAVRLYGPGHVVAYNYVANFHDGIDIETYGNPDGSHALDGPHYPPREYWDRRPVAIDYYNNYMTNFHDNAFEIDGSMHNVRVMRNMMLNSASHPFCNQPAIGGPIYWITKYRLPCARRIDEDDKRRRGCPLLQQYDLDGDLRGILGERPLAKQPDAGREFRSGDLQRQHKHELQQLGLQRIPS